MSITVACAECNARFEIGDDLGGQTIRCHHCGQPCRADTGRSHAFQAGRAPSVGTLADEIDPGPSPRRPTARPPFPWGPVAIITIGILFLLLFTSVMFNVYFFTTQPNRFRRVEEAMQAEQMAMEMRLQADKARELALANQEQAKLQELLAKQRLEEIQDKLDAARKQFDDANGQKAAPEWGTLEGRVTWKGAVPKVVSFEDQIRRSLFAEHVLKAPKQLLLDPTWRIDDKSKGVADVCVFLKRPADGMLPIHADDKKRKEAVVMDAPFCVFEPHIVALFPGWFDGRLRDKTGQKFIIRNSSPFAQNHRMWGDGVSNEGSNRNVPSKQEHAYDLNPQSLPLSVQCDIQVWMSARLWVFDHPYFALTKADGTFSIPRVPAGMEVRVMAWHEGQGWQFGKDGKAMTLKQGKNVLDFEMSAK